jgi:DNA-binding NarL/FixJ family response regulator
MTTANPLSLLLIDDHALLRAGLRMMLVSAMPEAAIREAGSIAEATGALVEQSSAPRSAPTRPDLILLDIELPGLNGLDGLSVLQRYWPDTPVVMLTSHTEWETRDAALARGAAGFLSKAESADVMVATLRAVLRGERAQSAAAIAPHLTPRQYEVLDQLCQGLSNKVIGRRLNMAENTVRVHVQGLLAALGASSRAQAVVIARQRGLVR